MAPPGPTTQVRVVGDEELQRKLMRAGVAITSFASELKRSGQFLQDFYSNDVFQTAGSAIGERWAPLNPATIARKGNNRILVDTGKMKGAFKFKASDKVAAVTNPTEYLKYHQFGTRKMPRRQVVKVTDRIANEVGDIFRKGLIKRLRRIF